VQENRSERRKSFQDALKDIVVASKEEIEKRKQIKEELTQGKGIKTSKKVVRLKLPLVSKQHDGWSCGLNTATRLLKYNNYDASYEGLIKQRKLVSLQLDSDKGPYTLPPALQRIMRRWHPESWWMTDVEFDVIKNLLRQNKPVAALIAIPGSYFKIKLGQQTIKAPASHWVVVSGFNDIKKTIYYYDPLKEGEQQKRYDDFLKVWATKPEDYMEEKFDPLLLTYGFIATRTIAFCN
jgi:hypothetical protein